MTYFFVFFAGLSSRTLREEGSYRMPGSLAERHGLIRFV
jgi:hypothetical protein